MPHLKFYAEERERHKDLGYPDGRCTPEEAAAMVAAITMFEEDRDSGPSGAARPQYRSAG
jgi:hypothetical protein